MRKNLTVEREFEREIIDHAAFLRDEEEAARIDWEWIREVNADWLDDLEMELSWELEDCGLTHQEEDSGSTPAHDCLGRRLDSYM